LIKITKQQLLFTFKFSEILQLLVTQNQKLITEYQFLNLPKKTRRPTKSKRGPARTNQNKNRSFKNQPHSPLAAPMSEDAPWFRVAG
jgi:hypothetical protein